MTLREVLASVRSYLDVAEGEDDYIVAALVAATSKALTDEEPLWMMLVGPPGGGKTEAIRLLDRLTNKRVDELTRAGLLSWSTGKRAKTVGVLTLIPRHALLTVSDFSTVVTAGDHDARARMFGMLRVVYDGRVYRGIAGQSGGDSGELEWEGHLTIVAAATNVIDTHTSFEGALGERWLMVRLTESSSQRSRARARYVMARADVEGLRSKAQEAAETLVLEARKRIPPHPPEAMTERLVDVAVFVATARTGVMFEGQGRGRVILGLPTPEEPTRLAGQLSRFARCALALGLAADDALALAVTVAIDSVPLARMRVLTAVAKSGDQGVTVADVHRALVRGNRWAAIYELDALDAIGILTVEGPHRDDEPKATRVYRLSEEWRDVYASVGFSCDSLSNERENVGSRLRIRTPSSPHQHSDPADNTNEQDVIDALKSAFPGSKWIDPEAETA